MDGKTQLEGMEGRRHEAYPDPLTKGVPWTIGVGHTGPEVVQGLVWTDEQIDAALADDWMRAERAARAVCGVLDSLLEPRRCVLVNMAFNLGQGRLSHFAGVITAVRLGDWKEASRCMLDSLWARQVPKRAARLARQMETGDWQ